MADHPRVAALYLGVASFIPQLVLLALPGAGPDHWQEPDAGVAGIRRRIIVISACHAGAFIPILKDPSTIIITAAAADRTSFGCSDDRDLTHFGGAFYRDALPTAATLDQAFATATASIARREASEHITPSKPQAYFGADLERILSSYPMRQPVLSQN